MKFRAKSQDTRNFIKLKAGESIQGVFQGDPYEFKTHWLQNEQRSVLCDNPALCAVCKLGDKPKFRFRVNFVVKEGDAYAAKVLEQGWTSYQALENLQESGYNLEKQIIVITRQGAGLNTSYSIIPSPKGLINGDAEVKIKEVKLNDLGHVTEAEKEPAEVVPPAHTDEDLPF